MQSEISGCRWFAAPSLFDLLNGGDKNWGRFPPYRDLGYAAAALAGDTFALGTAGAGFGATTVNLKGGLGSASAVTRDGHTVGALVAVNACGSANVGSGPHFWAAPFEIDSEFGGFGFPATLPPAALTPVAKGRPGENTTIAIVATDAALTKAQTKELAVMAQDGLARALYPAHTTLDGDTVFAAGNRAAATRRRGQRTHGAGGGRRQRAGAGGGPGRIRGQNPARRPTQLAGLSPEVTFAGIIGGLVDSASNWPLKVGLRI